MKNAVTTDEVIASLASFDGFQNGFNTRNKIIKLGAKLQEVRLQAQLTLKQGAELVGLESAELDDIECGSLVEPTPYVELERILAAYTDFMVKQRGAQVRIHYEITTANVKDSFEINAGDHKITIAEG